LKKFVKVWHDGQKVSVKQDLSTKAILLQHAKHIEESNNRHQMERSAYFKRIDYEEELQGVESE